MSTTNKLITPVAGSSGNLSINSTSANVSFASLLSGSEDTIRLISSVDCYIRLTNGAGTAVTTDVLVSAGIPEAFGIPKDATHLNAVTTSLSGTLNYLISKGC